MCIQGLVHFSHRDNSIKNGRGKGAECCCTGGGCQVKGLSDHVDGFGKGLI
jgi:hypothetical protein